MTVAPDRRIMRTSTGPVALVAIIVLCACKAPPPPESPPIARTTAAADVGAPRAPLAAADAPRAEAPASTVVEGPPRPAPRCRLTVTDTEGCQPNQVEDLVAPVRSRIEHCRGAGGGKLTVRVRREPAGKLAFDLTPGTSLDPTERKCVLDALNSLNQNESATAWTGGTSIPPTGFTSLLTIEW
jgi:hypothetical protein